MLTDDKIVVRRPASALEAGYVIERTSRVENRYPAYARIQESFIKSIWNVLSVRRLASAVEAGFVIERTSRVDNRNPACEELLFVRLHPFVKRLRNCRFLAGGFGSRFAAL